jgi:RHS repeat-associated protein
VQTATLQNRLKEYSYGFNGMEDDEEMTNANGQSYDFGARLYNPRVGRWLSRDPLERKYSELTPYNYVANMPLAVVDPDGKDIILVIYLTQTGESDHAAIAVEDYDQIKETVTEDGEEVIKTTYKSRGTYTFYELGPDVKKMGVIKAMMNVKGYYGKQESITEEQLKNENLSVYEDEENRPFGPDGVVKFETDAETDFLIRRDIESKIEDKEKYNGLKNNCTDLAGDAVDCATSLENDRKEEILDLPVVKDVKASTPNTLYNSSKDANNAIILKEAPEKKANKSYRDARAGN